MLPILVLVLSTYIFAEDRASISGTVRNLEGELVAGAQAYLMNADRAVLASAKTNQNGEFRFAGIRPGYYLLLVRAKGFQDFQRK